MKEKANLLEVWRSAHEEDFGLYHEIPDPSELQLLKKGRSGVAMTNVAVKIESFVDGGNIQNCQGVF